jgi:secondary thiamine-phosphate synthase enzyme
VRTIEVESRRRQELIDVTADVRSAVQALGLERGGVMLYVPHTTAAVTVNEGYDPDVAADVGRWMERNVPDDPSYAHAEGNSDAHIKSILVGSSLLLPVRDGGIAIGRWQGIFFCEFDGPRRRELWVQPLTA